MSKGRCKIYHTYFAAIFGVLNQFYFGVGLPLKKCKITHDNNSKALASVTLDNGKIFTIHNFHFYLL